MNSKFTQRLLGTFLAVLTLTVAAQIFVSGQKGEKFERSLEGTWRTVVTPRNCQTGEQAAPAFQGILSFNKGGTMGGISTTIPTAFGTWRREQGWSDYSFAFTNFRYNASGTFIGSQIVRQTAVLDDGGDQITTSGTVEFFDVNGNLIATGCATSIGTRFE